MTRTAQFEANPAEIREEMARILSSPDFVASEQLSRFLEYVVEEALAGRADLLKERNIAVRALGRDTEFDPRLDSIVRVVAGKLRRALDHYYAKEGAGNPHRLVIPKGGYHPVVRAQVAETTETASEAAAPDRKRLGNSLSTQWFVAGAAGGVVALMLFTAWWFAVGPESPTEKPAEGASPTKVVHQVGALPYRVRDGVVEILLVRTRRDSHWTIPKRSRNPDQPVHETAAEEAFREAGVRGTAWRTGIGSYSYARKDRSYRVTVYPVEVTEQVETWPEQTRKHAWYTIGAAAIEAESGELTAIIRGFDIAKRSNQ